MNIPDSQVRKMISSVVNEIDYDIWKEQFNYDTAEEPEMVEARYDDIEDIMRSFEDG